MVNINLNISDDFYLDECRNGYVVPKEMKEVWAIELDLLNEFQRVCKKHHIPYFACGGTMLGAVRHNGIVPWDDDIDVMLLRKDYEKLCEVANFEFKNPYFFQTEYTDPGSLRRHAQLRNSETTGMLNGEKGKYSFNQGIFIDIFPLDNIPNNSEDRKQYFAEVRKRRKILDKISRLTNRFTLLDNKGLKKILKFLVHPVFYILEKIIKIEELYFGHYEKAVCRYNDQKTKDVFMSLDLIENERWTWSSKCFEDAIDMPFEMLEIPVPANYEEMLQITYGEWREFVVGTSYHGGIFFDTEKTYKDYI